MWERANRRRCRCFSNTAMLIQRILLSVSILSIGLAACSDAAGPLRGSREVALAVGGEGNTIFVVDPAADRVLARPGPLPWAKMLPVISPDSSTLYFLAADQSGSAIYTLDVNSFGLTRWLDINSPPAVRVLDGLWLHGSLMGITPNGKELYIHAYSVDPYRGDPPLDDGRMAFIDIATRHVVASTGPLEDLRGTDLLPPGPVAPDGAILILGERLRDQAPSLTWLFVINPATRSIVDSAVVTPPNPGRGGTLSGVLASSDGQHVYLKGRDGTFYGYDLVERRVFATAHLTSGSARISISPDGDRIYAVDPGAPGIFVPSSLAIQVFDATNLTELAPINLDGQEVLNGKAPLVNNLVVSPDGEQLFLAAGAPKLFSTQQSQLLVMDLSSGVITKAIPLGDWGYMGLSVVH